MLPIAEAERIAIPEFPLNSTSPAYEAARRVLSGPGHVFGFTVYNSNASDQIILVFDSPVLPGSGATAQIVFKVSATSSLGVNWIPGRWFGSGCVICNSTTAPTLTIGAADCFFDAQYIG